MLKFAHIGKVKKERVMLERKQDTVVEPDNDSGGEDIQNIDPLSEHDR